MTKLQEPKARGDIRDHIVQSVRAVFYNEGVRHIGLEEILKVSGVAKATFYNHFQSKDDLILALLRQGDERWLSWFTQRVEAVERDPARRVWAVFDVLAEWYGHPSFRGCVHTNLGPELSHPDHFGNALYRAHMENVRLFLEKLARDAALGDPAGASRTLQLLFEGAHTMARLQRGSAPAWQAKEMALRLLNTQDM